MTDKYIDISKEAMECLDNEDSRPCKFWFCLDNGACAELAVKYRISTVQYKDDCAIASYIDAKGDYCKVIAKLADHNNDRMLATNDAILSAVIEISKEAAE